MKSFPKFLLLLAEFLVYEIPCAAHPRREVGSGTPLSIHVLAYNLSGLESAQLHEAMAVAAGVLHRSGIGLLWSDCSMWAQAQPVAETCRLALPPNGFVLVIQARFTAKLSRTALGYATVPSSDQFGNRLSVSLERAVYLAEEYRVPLASVLGCGIAHEIGHLLLKSQGHSATGLMRSKWGSQELVEAARGGLVFAKAEAARLQAGLRARVESFRAQAQQEE